MFLEYVLGVFFLIVHIQHHQSQELCCYRISTRFLDFTSTDRCRTRLQVFVLMQVRCKCKLIALLFGHIGKNNKVEEISLISNIEYPLFFLVPLVSFNFIRRKVDSTEGCTFHRTTVNSWRYCLCPVPFTILTYISWVGSNRTCQRCWDFEIENLGPEFSQTRNALFCVPYISFSCYSFHSGFVSPIFICHTTPKQLWFKLSVQNKEFYQHSTNGLSTQKRKFHYPNIQFEILSKHGALCQNRPSRGKTWSPSRVV